MKGALLTTICLLGSLCPSKVCAAPKDDNLPSPSNTGEPRTVTVGSHSLQIFYTMASHPSPTFPEYLVAINLDDTSLAGYNSTTQALYIKVSWMSPADDPNWERHVQRIQKLYHTYHVILMWASQNQTQDHHYLQGLVSCELDDDGTTRGFANYAYDGQDFIIFDKDTLVFKAQMPLAEFAVNILNREPFIAKKEKFFIEDECIKLLKMYFTYGRVSLERRVPPEAKVSLMKFDNSTTLICHGYGFYPREIEMKWFINGVEVESKEGKEILPNPDGNFQIKSSVDVPDGKVELYTCHLAHISLDRELIVQYEGKVSSSGKNTWIAVIVVVFPVVVIGITYCKKKHSGEEPMELLPLNEYHSLHHIMGASVS